MSAAVVNEANQQMIDSDYYIINRKPQRFCEMRIAGRTAVFLDGDGKVLDYGVLRLGQGVYAALYCEEVRNVTFVTGGTGNADVVTVLWRTDEEYSQGLEELRRAAEIRFSPQNMKLNRYAEAVAEKLALGIKLRITDAVNDADMVKCPECGMLNPSGSMYCLDCGAEI